MPGKEYVITSMANIQKCFICGQQVLGLIGQDLLLDTFYLRNGKEDQEVVAEGAFGICHLQCLMHSKWGHFWAKRIMENLRNVRRYHSLFFSDELQMLRNSAMLETVIVRMDGWVATVSDRSLLANIVATDGRFLPVSHEINVGISQHPSLIEEIEQELTARRSFALLKLINRLGLDDFLLYPEAVQSGEIRPLDSGGSTIKPISRMKDDIYLTAVLSYYQFLPEDFVQILLDRMSHSAS